jgi:hypothetical protein
MSNVIVSSQKRASSSHNPSIKTSTNQFLENCRYESAEFFSGLYPAKLGSKYSDQKNFHENDAASVSISMSDIFRTRSTMQISTSPFFYQEYYRLNNPQIVSLNFSDRFGKLDVSLLKRQNFKSSGTQDAMQISQLCLEFKVC